MELVKLKPAVKDYIWGGNYFQKFNKGLGLARVSECWELSLRDNDSSIIASGKDEGKLLNQAITNKDIGPVMERFPYFPLLIKLIDAKENLSVQVHPSDEYALKYENSFGKSEMWHIISADEGSGLYVGLNKDYQKQDIEKALKEGTILDCLNFFKVKPGDTFIINPGTIHAIGKGVRLIEIQQNSNLTYRLYDYNRVDQYGHPRELHIKKALEVINYHRYQMVKSGSSLLADNQYFTVKEISFENELEISANEKSFISFTFLEGDGTVNDISFTQYDTFFLPYQKKCVIKGKGKVVISSVR
ncbi:MAG: class I mannose-6-phosphate isomerase [Bacilli bacterium]|nr:class I mannose-6-phosphate isomerase [Bacilli bacterium]